ncbi:hypothetical protein DJ564_00240 [Pseudomonas sp. 31-12]|uniref:hypothetical protein n=1 Tax=Pseudomonas sp. 31-12 TaxID=2201356 RepID=UPI000D6B83F4|nr:hypothetical protein [Pseudomonas sp. 31-12]AWM89333.1 hypothetical protein DJ564_00240 [Pseudomonas sp. 31-12]
MKKYWLLSFLLLGACGDASDAGSDSMSKKPLIEIQMSETVKDVMSNSPVTFLQDCLLQANMCFYKFDKSFGDDDLPSVVVNKTLHIDQVVGVKIAVNQDVSEAVENLELTIRSIPSNSRHEEYQAFIYDFIKVIKNSGWSNYYAPSDPRISGSQLEKIASPAEVLGSYVMSHPWLDPDYEISLDKWLEIGKFYNWHFYNDGTYLTLRAWRRDSDDAPNDRATYLITLTFKSESAYWRSAFGKEEDKKRWKELLPGLLLKYKKQRRDLEEKAADAGIEVDSSYKDPTIQALN